MVLGLVYKRISGGKMKTAAFFAVLLVGCSCSSEPAVKKTIEYPNVRQFLMHDTYEFSIVFVDDKNKAHIKTLNSCDLERKLSVYFDVLPDQKQYAKIEFSGQGRSETVISGEVHLYTYGRINGAGWDHGKHGSGQTIKLE